MAEQIYHAVGKRKTSLARVWVRPGNGVITINKRPMDEYLTRESDRVLIRRPLELTDTLGKYDIKAQVHGGGLTGQAGAMLLGIARALVKADGESKSILRKNGFLTRDPRMVERKKYGQPGARKRFQFSKR